ncbi:MAG: PAS domain S-box protein [Candidatus Zixiibacteriota bacterium]|nr:MAG: PAS domain S-box protein [candidate division Zixibacteria bacterium]
MGRSGHRNRFESEIHLGFLIIVCLLMLLNFMSNYIIYRAANDYRESVASHLRSAGLAIGRAVEETYPRSMSATEKQSLTDRYRLTGLTIIPSQPADALPATKRKWFTSLVGVLPVTQLPELAEKLLKSDFNQLVRGQGPEYFYVYPLPLRAGGNLLILTADRPDLAYLDDSRQMLSYVLPGSLFLVVMIYLVLSRRIFSPFRKIKEQAARIGRSLDEGGDEAEAVVREYQRVIDSLRQKEAELLSFNAQIQQRADSMERLNQYLLESSDSGIITLDKEGMVLSVNNAASQILGLPSAQTAGGAPYRDLVAPYDELIDCIDRAYSRSVSSGLREIRVVRADGEELELGITVSPIHDREGNRIGVSALLNDFTELNRLRKDLEQKGRMIALGEMAGGLAHQLRNSMGAIDGYGNLVRKRLAASGQSTQHIEALMLETSDAESLISKFLSFSKPFEYTPRVIDLRSVLDETLSAFRARRDCQDIEFTLECTDGLRVKIDPALFKQAISNLVDNAVLSYEDHRGVVRVTVARCDDGISIEVEDRGSGIPEDVADKVFTPFYSSKPSGTGLGLPLAARIIDLHGGRISVSSQIGSGSVFRVHMPAVCVDGDHRCLAAGSHKT